MKHDIYRESYLRTQNEDLTVRHSMGRSSWLHYHKLQGRTSLLHKRASPVKLLIR